MLVKNIAICAGSGGSLFSEINKDRRHRIDLVITGELSHHEVLDCTQNGIAVILCGHCSSERHYLPTLKNILTLIMDGGVTCPEIIISETDRPSIEIV